MGKYTYHGDGIKSKPVTIRSGPRKGQTVPMYYFEVYWNGGRFTEKGGTTEREALRKQAQRLNEIGAKTYVPPRDRRRAERKEALDRERLRFDRATAAFVAACAAKYARPDDVRRTMTRLGKHFRGRFLDEITRADLVAYTEKRLRRDLRYSRQGTPKKGNSLRAPQADVRLLSAVYGFMQDAGFDLDNPCLRPARRGIQRKAETYSPTHDPVIPSPEALGAIFKASPARFTPAHRALIVLAAYTGGRPESDLLRLDHGDVELVDDSRAVSMDGTPILGWVWFRDPKTPAGRRKVPLHPRAAEALRAVLVPGADPETPIFQTTTRTGEPRRWNRETYSKAWENVVEAVAKDHPEVAGMWFRDLRKWFRTMLTDALIPEPTIRYLMGHARDVSMGYYVPPDASLRKAVSALPVPPAPAAATSRRVAV